MLKASVLALLLVPLPTAAGQLDVNLGLQATHTAWDDDAGGGPTLGVTWWFRDWIGASFVGKEHYATVDDRFMSYFSLNAAVGRDLGPLWLAASAGVTHQHEQTRSSIEAMPIASAFGVADGIRHRMASRLGFQVAKPFGERWYVGLDFDGTYFAEADRGPQWMQSIGLSIGFRYDFSTRKR